MKNRVSLQDVAKRAGVAIGTASRVLNGSPKASESAKNAVNAAILELGYRPNSAARTMRKNHGEDPEGLWSGNIGFVLSNMGPSMFHVPLIADLIDKIGQHVSEAGYHLLIDSLTPQESVPRLLTDRKVEALIAFGDVQPEQGKILAEQLPCVGIGSFFVRCGIPQVNVDNQNSIRSAVEVLYRAGKRRIAYVCSEPEWQDFRLRHQGYAEKIRELGLPEIYGECSLAAVPAVKQAELIPPDMSGIVSKLFDTPFPPDALICANDWQSVGVFRAFEKMGLVPGRDAAIIGFDNDIHICESLMPRLTSIQFPVAGIAESASALLLRKLKNSDEILPAETFIPGEIIERDSFKSALT